MRPLLVFLFGVLLGLGLVMAALWYNPLERGAVTVPIDDNERTLVMDYDSPISGSLFYINSGFERLPRNPAGLDALFYPSQRGAHVAVFELRNRRAETVGIGIKHAALGEATQLMPPVAAVNSAWQVLLPGAGSFFVHQQENYWPFLHDVLLPAAIGGGGVWQGSYRGDTTVGPKGTLEAIVVGSGGLFAGRGGVAKETLSLSAFSLHASGGPATPFATLTIVPEAAPVAPAPDPVNPPSE